MAVNPGFVQSEIWRHKVFSRAAAKRKGTTEQAEKDICLKNGSSQVQDLALTVLIVLTSVNPGFVQSEIWRHKVPRCRAHTRRSRPDFGLCLSRFSGKIPQNRCCLLAVTPGCSQSEIWRRKVCRGRANTAQIRRAGPDACLDSSHFSGFGKKEVPCGNPGFVESEIWRHMVFSHAAAEREGDN